MGLIATIQHAGHRLSSKARRVLGTGSPRGGQGVYEASVRFGGRRFRPVVRAGTTDLDRVHLILCENSEYRLPSVVRPKVIFDIGANIGTTAIYYAAVYPEADIYCFEPLPENVELLRINARRHSDRIHVIPKGVSDQPGTFAYAMSRDERNFGGGGFSYLRRDPSENFMLPVTTVKEAMQELGIDQVDVFKIDTEGSELAILKGIPQAARQQAQAFIGELHGIGNWDVCELLSQSHALGVNKRLEAGCFPFVGLRKDLAGQGTATRHAA